jgi:hypothetical protein
LYDSLSIESQTLLKISAFCGTNFKFLLLVQTIQQLKYSQVLLKLDEYLFECLHHQILSRVDLPHSKKCSSSGDPFCSLSEPTVELPVSLSIKYSDFTEFSFVSRKYRECIYQLMLEGQKQELHEIIANLLEKEVQSLPSSKSISRLLASSNEFHDNHLVIVELMAFHYSKSINIAQEIRYTETAAKLASQRGMSLVSFNYYHHLIQLAYSKRSIGQIIAQCFSKSPVNKARGPTLLQQSPQLSYEINSDVYLRSSLFESIVFQQADSFHLKKLCSTSQK